ncbi:methyltransferase type 11 [Brevundimonas sp.]|uniref:methyltransferase type 11 n=1 Tax=Brevundimonas sp. TaxID=1871086 RepID=UPI00286A18E9|nr:methyltransferase type 11 [Brevundimonas sp.]
MRLLLATICTACLMTAACDGESVRISSTTTDTSGKGVLKVIDTLQCPETIGVLTRKGTAHAGGATCLYSGPRGAEVTLQLIALSDQTVDVVLQRFENTLSADMPHTMAELRNASAEADRAEAAADAAGAQADVAAAEADAAAAEANAAADSARVRAPGMAIDAEGDRARVRLPGMSVDADGDKASVRIGGFSINADDSSETVDISSSDESVSIQAHDDAAEIRTRAPGDATRRTYMLTDRTPADKGWRLVGFEARGPVGGPIVIATVRAKDRDSDGVFDSAKDLVTLNVGE